MAAMAPQNDNTETMQAQELPTELEKKKDNKENYDETISEESIDRIPVRLWMMHGLVMFGREFVYALETALVTPILLQIGLPEQFYSLTWFLSPVFGLMLSPVMGSASDRCTLKWGRRRPFVLILAIGILIGVALFLNGSIIGLAIGDEPNRQPIGIVLTVAGVVIMDFGADASEGPIRAYLLDVAEPEEQDVALNIHACAAGLGGAFGYMVGGLDWTQTALGRVFGAQEQILFVFTIVIFVVSVTLHLFSIEEEVYNPYETSDEESEAPSAVKKDDGLLSVPHDLLLGDEFTASELPHESYSVDLGFLGRTQSDSVLHVPETKGVESEMMFLQDIESSTIRDHSLPSLPFRSSPEIASKFNQVSASREHEIDFLQHGQKTDSKVTDGPADALHHGKIIRTVDGVKHSMAMRRRRHMFHRQPTRTFSYYGKAGFRRYRFRRANAVILIKSSRSMNDLYDLQKRQRQRQRQLEQAVTPTSSETESEEEETETTVKLLWLSMLKMPKELLRLCVCHLITCFAFNGNSVFFTDFMGQVVYKGDPQASSNSTEFVNYNTGVQMGSWGLVVFAITTAGSSAILQKYLDHYDLSIKVIYIIGTLPFSIGTAVMAIFPNVYVAMTLISTMGLLTMSNLYCPYALLGQYHEIKAYRNHSPGNTKRGFGIDCAILSCQVYLAQILVSTLLGGIVEGVGTVRAIPVVASISSFLGFLCALCLLIYPDTQQNLKKENKETLMASSESNEKDAEKPVVLQLHRKGASEAETESAV